MLGVPDPTPRNHNGGRRNEVGDDDRLFGEAQTAERTDQRIYLQSIDRHLPAVDIDRPALAVLITEDLCWRFMHADWAARRPRPWHRAQRAAWRSEGAVVEAKRDRIRAMAGQLRLR